MRIPQSWHDKGLLEDEPFLSAFKARQLAGPPARRDADSENNRNKAVAKELEKRKLLNTVVQAWVDLAFELHRDDLKRHEVKASEPGMLNLFVRFYWALFMDHESAAAILQDERRRRGYEYVLSIPLRGESSVSTTKLTKLKVHPKQTQIFSIQNDVIDEKTKTRPSQQEDVSGNMDHVPRSALPVRGQLPLEKVAGSILSRLKFKKKLNSKKDVPSFPERKEKCVSQISSPSLNSTSLSEKRDPSQIELNSSTLPLPPTSQNMIAACDLPKARRKHQTSPDSRRIKRQKFSKATSDTSKLCNVSNASTSTQPDSQVINLEAGDNLKPQSQALSRPQRKENTLTLSSPPLASSKSESTKFKFEETALSLSSNPSEPNINDPRRGLEANLARGKQRSRSKPGATKKTRVPPPRLEDANTELRHVPNCQSLGRRTGSRDNAQKNPSSNLQSKQKHMSQDCRDGLSKVDAKFNASPLPPNSAIFNSSDLGRYAATSRIAFTEKEQQESLQTKDIVVDKRAILAKLRFKRISKPETNVDCPPGTSPPRIHESVLKSSDRCDTSTVCDPSNSRKRHLGNLNILESGNNTVPSQDVSVGRPEQTIMTSHRESKRRKVIQGETKAEPGKDGTIAPAHKPSRRKKGTRTKKQGSFKVEPPPDRFTILQSVAHPTMDLPAVNESLSHRPMQGETNGNPKKRRASSLEDRRQDRGVDGEDSVLMTVQPNTLKKRRGRPRKVKEFEQGGSTSISVPLAPRKKKDRPPKPKGLSLSQAQSNDGTALPFSGQIVGIKHETSISKELSRHHVPAPWASDRNIKEELINRSENWSSAQEHNVAEENFTSDCVALAATQMENHPVNILPTQKPPLCVNPPIWAQSRQEVCETFDWFRSYQGGVYFAHNIVKGYLLSAFSSKRDRFEHDGRLIISHGGGKSDSLHTRKGHTTAQPATDQLAEDKSVRALLDNYRNQRPLVLLIDDKYVLFPYDLGAKDMTYVVLGFYLIAHAWAEYQPANNGNGHVVRYKFAFRWCDDQGLPWWLTNKETDLSDLTPPSIPTTFSSKPTSKRTPKKQSENDGVAMFHTTMVRETVSSEPKSFACSLCHMDSPCVYTWAWLCLHPKCSRFWRDSKGNFPPDNLEYDFNFLTLRTSLAVPPDFDFGKLKPNLPSRLSTNKTVTSYPFTRGFHCKSCGRLSCRFKWEKWECSNCEECFPVSRPAHEAKDFWSNLLPIGYKDHLISRKSKVEQQSIRIFTHENGMGNIQSFILPDGRGKIHHIQPGTSLGRLEADHIFIEYQQQAAAGELKFRRWPLRSHKCRGALLSNYFSQNSGEPYQYVGGAANTVPFENAPGAVVKARALIQKRIQQALGTHVEFNEVLSAAYMERQKMAFHSDNETGLGPVVAGLSLGSPALMHFRIRAKYDPLRELKGNLLSFVLRHGDVLVMDGIGVQEYYEHTVIPNNFRIAATARQINSGHPDR